MKDAATHGGSTRNAIVDGVGGGASGRKRCRACGVLKPEAEFHRNLASGDGRRTRCARCMSDAVGPGLRRPPFRPTAEQVEHMTTLYGGGATCAEIAVHFNANPKSVWRTLKESGVEIRRAGARDGQFAREKNWRWTGGRSVTSAGYVRLKLAPDDPFVCMATKTRNRHVMEHRYVMAHHLGRPLLPDENVHHLNGVKDDNRIENLELWSTTQPQGQRVADLVVWAREILERYDKLPAGVALP